MLNDLFNRIWNRVVHSIVRGNPDSTSMNGETLYESDKPFTAYKTVSCLCDDKDLWEISIAKLEIPSGTLWIPDHYHSGVIRSEMARVINIDRYDRYIRCMSSVVANGKVEYKPGTTTYADKLPRPNNENGIYAYFSEEELRQQN